MEGAERVRRGEGGERYRTMNFIFTFTTNRWTKRPKSGYLAAWDGAAWQHVKDWAIANRNDAQAVETAISSV